MDTERLKHSLRQMLTIREFENEVMRLFSRGLIRGSTHLGQGQEAVAVGVCDELGPADTMLCTYRGHAAVIAKGASIARCFGELLGRTGGLSNGRGGSMHFADVSVGAFGANAIVGGHLPIAVGLGWGHLRAGTSNVSVAFTGDGSTNIGAFHESLNLAAVWKLPVVFVIENNLYGEYSPLASTTPISRLADRGASYAMPAVTVDGNDVEVVREAAADAVARARAGQGPTLIEALTYRHSGHSRSDPAKYRPDGELEDWLSRDPISLARAALTESGSVTEHELEALTDQVASDVAAARDESLQWPEPSVEDLFADVYSSRRVSRDDQH